MKKFIGVLISFLMITNLCACDNKKNPSNQTIYYNLKKDPISLDPQIANDESANLIIVNIFEGLVKIDSNNNIVPGVSENYEANSDFTSFTFNLRKNASWSDKDSTPVTANDFVFGIKRAVAPKTKSPTAYNLFSIKNAKNINLGKTAEESIGVYALDDHTLKIDLEYPYKEFPKVMALPVAMPCNKKLFEATIGQYGLKSEYVPSNGPFRVKPKYGWEHKKSLTLEKNLNYKGDFEAVPIGVNFSIGELSGSVFDNIENDKIDAGLLNNTDVDKAKNNKYNITSFEDTTWGLSFNLDDVLFKNINVRKAFVQSIKRDYILSKIPDNSSIANDIIMSSVEFEGKNYRSLAGDKLYLHNDANAKSFLKTGLSELGLKELPNVSVLCIDDPVIKSMVSDMLEVWNGELNNYFNMEPISADKLNEKLSTGDYQLAIAPIQITENNPLHMLQKFTSESDYNICNMNDSNYDSLIKKAIDANSQEQLNLCIQAEKYVNDHAVFYPLYCGKRFFASAPNVKEILFYQYGGGVDFSKSIKSRK